MTQERLRRVLFPSPRPRDDRTSTKSIQRIRPKAELTPINLDSTPSFKQLVESSPVPLAVAAATAAMRAAKSAQTGRGVITDMTRAAEEVIKNSEQNVIRPPLPSPRSLASPQFSQPVRGASNSLPRVFSPRPAGLMSTIRTAFSAQRTSSRSSLPPVIPLHRSAETNRVKQNKAILAATNNQAYAASKKPASASVRPSNSRPVTADSPAKTGPDFLGTHSPRARTDFLSRLFGKISPVPFAGVTESPTDANKSREDIKTESNVVSKKPKTVEGTRKERDGGSDPDITQEKRLVKTEKQVISRMQTRSLKRAKPRSHGMVTGAIKSEQPAKRRRMSEVLRLQKSLESAAWTNSLAIEKQTEVIVISDDSPTRSRSEPVLKLESKKPRKSEGSKKFVQSKVSQQTSKGRRKLKPKESAREDPGLTTLKRPRDRTRDAHENHQTKPRYSVKKRRVSATKRENSSNSTESEGVAAFSPHATMGRRKGRKTNLKQVDARLDRPRKVGAVEGKRSGRAKPSMNVGSSFANKSVAAPSRGDTPLKKRFTAEQNIKRKLEPSLATAALHTASSKSEDQLQRSSRKPTISRRLNPPVLNHT